MPHSEAATRDDRRTQNYTGSAQEVRGGCVHKGQAERKEHLRPGSRTIIIANESLPKVKMPTREFRGIQRVAMLRSRIRDRYCKLYLFMSCAIKYRAGTLRTSGEHRIISSASVITSDGNLKSRKVCNMWSVEEISHMSTATLRRSCSNLSPTFLTDWRDNLQQAKCAISAKQQRPLLFATLQLQRVIVLLPR